MPLSLEKALKHLCVDATALSWTELARLVACFPALLCGMVMEYAVYAFLETKEVNSILCSEYKPVPHAHY